MRLIQRLSIAMLFATGVACAEPAATPAPSADVATDTVSVTIETSKGNIDLVLYPNKAPQTVANFVKYARDGGYDMTIFHRVINNFMIQGGGFTADMNKKPTRAPIQNEADNGLKNERGTIAMARTGVPHSATNQFFINVKDNGFLNHTGKNSRGWGYAVFGKVVKGIEVVDAIKAVRTGRHDNGMGDVPVEPVYIKTIRVN